jgi:hypothetical protein
MKVPSALAIVSKAASQTEIVRIDHYYLSGRRPDRHKHAPVGLFQQVTTCRLTRWIKSEKARKGEPLLAHGGRMRRFYEYTP